MIATILIAAIGCGGDEAGAGTQALAGADDPAASESDALSGCPSTTRQLVCGRDGRTYTNICRAGGIRRVAHVGACAGFSCNGVACVSGFLCKTFTTYGVPVDQCVSNTGQAPACACASDQECVQDPSGDTRCVTPAAAPPPPDPATLCDGRTCPAGQHCAVTTINYGVPAASCMYD